MEGGRETRGGLRCMGTAGTRNRGEPSKRADGNPRMALKETRDVRGKAPQVGGVSCASTSG